MDAGNLRRSKLGFDSYDREADQFVAGIPEVLARLPVAVDDPSVARVDDVCGIARLLEENPVVEVGHRTHCLPLVRVGQDGRVAPGRRIQVKAGLGSKYGSALDVNNRDEVVGWAARPDGSGHAFISRNGQMTDLGTLLGDGNSWARAVNNAGQVVGWSDTSKCAWHAFLWQNGIMTDLSPATDLSPPAAGVRLGAVDINERGQVLCERTTEESSQGTTVKVVLWEKGVVTELGGFPQERIVRPLHINDAGQVLAQVGDRLFLWQAGSVTEVAKTGGGQSDLTERGKVYYPRVEANGGEGWVGVWDSGRATNLGALDGYLAWPVGANEAGEIVGSAQVKPGKSMAFRWKDGKLTLLRVDGDTSMAVAINERGTVAGFYSTSG
jgi:probable HAF family extracellular repeat protein